MSQPEKTIAAQLDNRRAALIDKNRELIKSVAKTVYLCGKQGISLRGHRDDSTASQSVNHGNFLELLRFRSDGGDLRLTEHLAKRRRNATYTSKAIQNELILPYLETMFVPVFWMTSSGHASFRFWQTKSRMLRAWSNSALC